MKERRVAVSGEPVEGGQPSGVAAPGSANVDYERRVLLWLPDGRALCRVAGFQTAPVARREQ